MKLKRLIAKAAFITAFGLTSLTHPISAQELKQETTQTVTEKRLTDIEHARSIGTIIHEGSEALQIGSNDDAKKYTIINGKVFEGKRWPPDMHIRPIDGNQTLYIKGNIEYSFKNLDYNKPEFSIKTKIPIIFDPEVTFDKLIIDGQKIDPSKLEQSKELSTIKFRISLEKLAKKNILNKSSLEDKQVKVQYEMRIKLNEYKIRKSSEFGSFEQLKKLSEENHLPLLVKRHPALEEKIERIMKENKTPYDVAKAIFKFTIEALEFERKELHLSITQAIKQGKGDCDDYTKIMTDLLKYAGIPAVKARAYVKDDDAEGSHAFPIFALPLKDRKLVWIISEPTWADDEPNPDDYFQQKDRAYMLDLEINVEEMNLSGDNLKYVTMISAGKPIEKDPETHDKLHNKGSSTNQKN